MVLLGVVLGKMLGRAMVIALPVVHLVVLSTAMNHRTEALEEFTMHHAFLAVVVISLAVDGTGDTFLILLTLL